VVATTKGAIVKVRALGIASVCAALASGMNGRLAAGDKFFPPLHTTLGCEGTDLNAIIVDCEGSEPYDQLTCTFTRVIIATQDAASSEKNRAEFLAAAARMTEADRQRQIADACKQMAKEPGVDFAKLSAPVRLMRDRGLQYMRAVCDCRGKEPGCLTRAMLPTLDAEERACTVTVAKHHDTFRRVDKDRWVYSESLPVSCVAASTQVLENDPQYSGLWTWTLNEIAAHPNPFPKDPLCAAFKGTNEVCSWKHPVAGLMNCEEVHLR
jgi:hypothetical protein